MKNEEKKNRVKRIIKPSIDLVCHIAVLLFTNRFANVVHIQNTRDTRWKRGRDDDEAYPKNANIHEALEQQWLIWSVNELNW